ncbi:MAG: hypothetical protein ACM65L_17570 [Microcoleus sp.]
MLIVERNQGFELSRWKDLVSIATFYTNILESQGDGEIQNRDRANEPILTKSKFIRKINGWLNKLHS